MLIDIEAEVKKAADYVERGELLSARIILRKVQGQLNEVNKFHHMDFKEMKPILCIDFDGTLSEYKAGWEGAGVINDEPVDGAIQYLKEAVVQFEVVIFSSRCNYQSGIHAMHAWLRLYGLSRDELKQITFQPGKPPAFAMIDDRAIQFKGDWDASDVRSPCTLKKYFKPWYYDRDGR